MKLIAAASILSLSVMLLPFLRMDRAKSPDKDIVAVKASAVKWEKPEGMPEGLWVSHLSGESKTAPFVDMMKFAGGTRVPLHYHSANHLVSVVSGALIIGKEGQPDESMGMEVGPGGYFRIAAKTPHWTMAKEDTIIVVSGDRMNDTHFLDKEDPPRKK
jgi:quercetin dioxygenase-like cupin family protein